ncbi:hypothetical protein LCGC14_2562950, partial [marine sediment metagenome]
SLTSLTIPFDLKQKQKEVIDTIRAYLAAGLDPKKSTLFLQSAVSAHTELAWILMSTITPVGELRRMTQFKEKSGFARRSVNLRKNMTKYPVIDYAALEATNVGLLTYPVLMAADILLYDTKFVPVGHDQLQHLELTRELARRFNKRFGKIFIEPKPLLTETPRLMSLNDPARKMSKSHPAGCLFLDDKPADIRKKIQRAVTDSKNKVQYDKKEANPAVSNLMRIYKELTNKSIREIEQEFSGKGYAEFKKALADVVVDALKVFREKKRTNESLMKVLKRGNVKAVSVATKKLTAVKKRIGLI